jgi:signal transduction histidine kinase
MTRKGSRLLRWPSSTSGVTSAEADCDAESGAPRMRDRLMSVFVRPTTPPLWLGILVATSLIAVETLLVYLLKQVAPETAFGAVFLLGVLVVSARWGFGLSVMTTLASAAAYVYFHLETDGGVLPTKVQDWVAIIVFLPIALLANVLAGQARLRAVEADQRRREAEASRDELRMLAAELTASRARIVTAADGARRRFERDLHDGAQQRLISLGLQLRSAEASVPPELRSLKEQISGVVGGLTGVAEDLQAISRGIHPAILSRGGLGPALKTLARRSTVPVVLDLGVDRRLPEPTEVAAYYVVSEALTNAAKHAQATEVNVSAQDDGVNLCLSIRDDGIGGADFAKGSGLIGLRDRIEALGGQMDVQSRQGSGTSLLVKIPFDVGDGVKAER